MDGWMGGWVDVGWGGCWMGWVLDGGGLVGGRVLDGGWVLDGGGCWVGVGVGWGGCWVGVDGRVGGFGEPVARLPCELTPLS